jgi:hypothetical protein
MSKPTADLLLCQAERFRILARVPHHRAHTPASRGGGGALSERDLHLEMQRFILPEDGDEDEAEGGRVRGGEGDGAREGEGGGAGGGGGGGAGRANTARTLVG